MKLTAQEIIRYGAETEREKTLVGFIESLDDEIERVGQVSIEADEYEEVAANLEDFIDEIMESFANLDNKEFLAKMGDFYKRHPL